MTLANFGYGTHALVRTARGPWWTEAESLFGLKLGWLAGGRAGIERGFVCNQIDDVERVVLLSDGLLEDDHRDPHGTLAGLAALNRRSCLLPFEQVAATALATAPSPPEDDLTVVVIERGVPS